MSYTLELLLDLLVRRNRRQLLASIWKPLTEIHLTRMEFDKPHGYYKWRTRHGSMHARFLDRPQRWAALRESSKAVDSTVLPRTIREFPDFAILFALVCPHRFDRPMLKLIEDALDEAR
ncbi:MAG: hypothetical protein IID45_02240 [Planctomycetes bacterium]|nr:hypothetical protein [Planctomycetota bacterium]